MKSQTKFIIKPNIERVLVQLLTTAQIAQQVNILVPGQLKAGENLLYGKIIASAEGSKLKPGMYVYYSEYSASAVKPLGMLRRGELKDMSAVSAFELYAVAEDDIMAYEEEVDINFVEEARDAKVAEKEFGPSQIIV